MNQADLTADGDFLDNVLESWRDNGWYGIVQLDGPRSEEKPLLGMLACFYPYEPLFRITEGSEDVEEIQQRILHFQVPWYFVRYQWAKLTEFTIEDIRPGTPAHESRWRSAMEDSIRGCLPVAMVQFSQFQSGDKTVHFWFPDNLMPDDVLLRCQNVLKRLRESGERFYMSDRQ